MERVKTTTPKLAFDAIKSAFMAESPATLKTEQYCAWRLDFKGVKAKQFTNGTLYIEGTDTALVNRLSQIATSLGGTAPPAKKPSAFRPVLNASSPQGGLEALKGVAYIGTDESGKGDYFGPLVVAGVFVTPQTSEALVQLGVMDSKKLTDSLMMQMAPKIEAIVGKAAISVIEMGPDAYNRLYDQFKASGKNLNHLLAWGHAKALETLLEANPECLHAIADQFGSEHYIKNQLKTRGREITLYQTPKAEANIGVAAASILARCRFVAKLQRLGQQVGVNLPPGASQAVVAAAKRLASEKGPEALRQVAKLHFKTTQTVLG